MLSKDDLAAFDRLISKQLNPFKEQIKDLEIKLEDKTADLEMAIFKVRTELQEEAKSIKRTLREIKINQNSIIKFFNEDQLELKKQISKIEQVLKLN